MEASPSLVVSPYALYCVLYISLYFLRSRWHQKNFLLNWDLALLRWWTPNNLKVVFSLIVLSYLSFITDFMVLIISCFSLFKLKSILVIIRSFYTVGLKSFLLIYLKSSCVIFLIQFCNIWTHRRRPWQSK